MLPATIVGRPLLTSTRALSATYTCLPCRLRQLTDAFGPVQDEASSRKKSPIKWKHLHPNGRVVGQGKKRQRVVSADLTRKSLDQPSSVILLRDVEADDTAAETTSSHLADVKQNSTNILSAREIEDEVVGRRRIPNDAEVKASIDGLKPDTSLLTENEFDALAQQLAQSYTLQQLSRYLCKPARIQQRSLKTKSEKVAHSFNVSKWQPGVTPLSERRQLEAKSIRRLSRKERTAQDILRLIWNVKIHSEEQAIGELELGLLSWQMSMLFDLSRDGTPGYKRLTSSGLLTNATKIEAYHPDSVARVTGRRRDAEEIAAQIQAGLQDVRHQKVDLKALERNLRTTDLTHTDITGHLRQVAIVTGSTIEPLGDGCIAIYNSNEIELDHAHRLVVSIINVSKDVIHASTHPYRPEEALGESRRTEQILVEGMSSGMHLRLGSMDLFRTVLARPQVRTHKNSKNSESVCATRQVETLQTPTVDLTQLLQRATSIDRNTGKVTAHSGSYWDATTHNEAWSALFGRILKPSAASERDGLPEPRQIHQFLQPRTPGLESLLSYFKTSQLPNTEDAHGPMEPGSAAPNTRRGLSAFLPYLKAYFLPSSVQGRPAINLPEIQMRFRFAKKQDPRGLFIVGITAIVGRDDIAVPLPDRAIDLVFSRRTSVYANVRAAISDVHIKSFTNILGQSAVSGDGALAAPQELIIRLPRRLVTGEGSDTNTEEAAAGEDVPVTYLLERFEQIQEARLIPDPQKAGTQGNDSLLKDFGKNLQLKYKDVEGGMVYGGARTELSLRFRPDSGALAPEDVETYSTQLTETALRITELLDRATAGNLDGLLAKAKTG